MANINTIATEQIQVGLAGLPPISSIDVWPSLDPTIPFSVQTWGSPSNFNAIHNQNGLYNGMGLWSQIGAYTGLGWGSFVGGHTDAQPKYDSSAPQINFNSVDGNLNSFWNLNGSPIVSQATDYDSDINLKKNIEPLQGSLDKILQLQGVSFDWDETKVPRYVREGKKETGFIAQEVEKVLPDIVYERTNEDGEITKMVKHKNMISLLVESIKEQQEQINSLKETVQELSTKLAECCS